MPIALGYEYDLFISYARQDDYATQGQDGWVTQFLSRLDPALRSRLGGFGKSLKIFFDRAEVGANYELPELLSAAKKSALFVAIGSPCYVSSNWCNQEVEAFTAQAKDSSRIFVVEYLPMNPDEAYPAVIANHIHLQFWKSARHRNTPMPLSPTADGEDFLPLIHGLAVDLREKLTKMRVMPLAPSLFKAEPFPQVPAGPEVPEEQRKGVNSTPSRPKDNCAPRAKTVFVAQGTDDVEDELEQLRKYLSQFPSEISVLPARGYPQGGESFRAAVQADLARSDLFVQLLGPRSGRKPPDLPEGYTLCQTEAARAAHVTLMQWRHPDLDPGTVSDPRYRDVLNAETVVASGLEAFKREILNWVREPPPKPRTTRSSTVFINADDRDLTIAKEVERECLAKALTTVLPMTGPSSEAKRQDLAETLTECDVLVFIYGDTTQDWIRAQLRFFNKVKARREAEPKLLAICSGPPPKPEIGMSFPNAHIINCPDGWNLAPIRKLIEEVGQ